MARNIDTGIKRTVVAKLCERGMANEAAETLASTHMAAATTVFQTALAAHGLPGEDAYDAAFAALKTWAQTL